MKSIKFDSSPENLASINFVPCEKCRDDYWIYFHPSDNPELCTLCPKSQTKYAKRYRDYKEEVKSKSQKSHYEAASDFTESSMEEMINYIRYIPRDADGNIHIKLRSKTYIFTDDDISIMNTSAREKGSVLYEYLEKMIGANCKVIVSCESAILLNKSKNAII